MLRSKHIDQICLLAAALALAAAVLLAKGEALGLIAPAHTDPEYTRRLFDAGRVHTLEIFHEDWEGFLAGADREEYSPCDLVIDGERFSRVGIRVKGNNSRRLVSDYGLERYSLKLEFDHYTSGSYHGLDKFSLDAAFQDNSYLKNFLAYDMMAFMEVPSPLCSYVWVRVNGQDWGLFLAVEEPEEAFARRNFGSDHGQLYKPDYRSLNDENADVALRYTTDDPADYDNIFRNAKFPVSDGDKARLIGALKILDSGQELEQAVDIDEVVRYFVVQVFVVNLDGYLGRTGHNYFLYEENGVLQMLPWDYNLAFATYSLGMPDPVNDSTLYINWPIDTPGETARNRPLYHELMLRDDVFALYHEQFDRFLREYFESGHFETLVARTREMIAPYVEKDPTAFCSYEDHMLAADTLEQVCLLRAQSVRGQLEGEIPPTIRGQQENPGARLEAEHIQLEDLGDFEDLEESRERHRIFLDGLWKSE